VANGSDRLLAGVQAKPFFALTWAGHDKVVGAAGEGGIHIRDVANGDDRVLADAQARPLFALTWAGNDSIVAAEGSSLVTFSATTGAKSSSAVQATVISGRGRFGTIAFFDGTTIKSLNVTNGETVPLVTPPRGPVMLDADASGGSLIWVDATGDVWTWSGGEPNQVASGMAAAAW
jgi:hypothetical protein